MTPTVSEIVRAAAARLKEVSDTSRLDAELLLAHLLGIERGDLLMKHAAAIPEDAAVKFNAFIERRLAGVPVAYLTNRKYFFEDEFFVDERVLIPRPETEHLVEEALRHLRYRPDAAVLDLCCGSGCIGLTLARFSDTAVLFADRSPEALAVTRINAERLFPGRGERFRFVESDLFGAIGGSFDIITVNPPYLSAADMTAIAGTPVAHEPVMALDGGPDGFDLSRRILADAHRYLNPGGHLLMELGFLGAPMARTARTDLRLIDIVKDYNGIERVAVFTSGR